MKYLKETTNNILRSLIMEAEKDENPFDNPPDPNNPSQPLWEPDDDGFFPDGRHETLPDAVPGQGPWRPDIDPGNVNPASPKPLRPYPHPQSPYFENPTEVDIWDPSRGNPNWKPSWSDPDILDNQNINNPHWQPGRTPGGQYTWPWAFPDRFPQSENPDFGTPIDKPGPQPPKPNPNQPNLRGWKT